MAGEAGGAHGTGRQHGQAGSQPVRQQGLLAGQMVLGLLVAISCNSSPVPGTVRVTGPSTDTYRTVGMTEPFPSWLCLANLQYVDGLGKLAGAPGAAAELTEDSPGLELGISALAG